MIPHANVDPNYTFVLFIAFVTIILMGYGVYKSFFSNDNLTDPWDDHDD
tara:strand:- start:2615 stop:2761 length:147 start_codon:yes stop_codon:yes gene_type:complete